ncbi:MAG TPA: MMPL family transporter [Gemmataceae bacterium]|nr:MMPL family transporter [Gemmataceae bacterium]
MFYSVGRLATAHPWIVCAAWFLAGGAITALAPAWDSKAQDDDIRFLPERCPSVRGYHLLEKSFPKDISQSRAIFAVEREDGALTDADFKLVDGFVADLNDLRTREPDLQIGQINSYRDGFVGNRLTSKDRHCTLIQVSLGTPYLALQTRATVDRAEAELRKRLAKADGNEPTVLTTGPGGIGRDLIRASADSLEGTTLATVALVVVVLLLVYRAPLLALVPLMTIGIAVWVAIKTLALMTLIPGVHLVSVSKIFAIVILYGAGTDYCLFLISRYREELNDGLSIAEAIEQSVGKVGGALAASAGTVICGLGMMGLAEFAKVRCAGPAIALSLAMALLASLTLTPALLAILGRKVFWLSWRSPIRNDAGTRGRGDAERQIDGVRRHAEKWKTGAFAASPRLRVPASSSSLWDRISQAVVKHPALIFTVTVAVLAPLAFLGLRVEPNYRPTGELAPTSQSIQGIAAIQRHFTTGETGPLTVLLVSPTDWNTLDGKELIAHLCRGFANLPNVAEVRSLTQPLGAPIKAPPPEINGNSLLSGLLKTVRRNIDDALEQANRAAREFYCATLPAENSKSEIRNSKSSNPSPTLGNGNSKSPSSNFGFGISDFSKGPRFVTRLDVVFGSDPFDQASKETLNLIQIWLEHELPKSVGHLGGVQAECFGVTVGSNDLAQVTEADRARVNLLVLAGIFLILLILVRKPWLAAYLLITVLFSYYATLGATVLAGHFYTGRALDQVDWRVPFFLFTILVAVGEDYNILLITRVLQERKQHGMVEGTRRALAQTGGTITSCGLIMAGTFATLMLGGLGTLIQIGFALAFGVLLDTFVIRPFMVPAFTLLVWREKKEQSDRGSGQRGDNGPRSQASDAEKLATLIAPRQQPTPISRFLPPPSRPRVA